ncbi:MAG: glycosyltransferase [Patescibacteria group bacterium]|jgi:glycosyltransferase involved in cell wall biosynthesis
MKKTVTCIVPFLNEEERISSVLSEMVKVRNINQIIAIDGGSNDNGYIKVKKFLQVKLIKLEKNIGKTETVKKGVAKNHSDYILLFDADLTNVNYLEIELVINKIINDEKIDMIIFNRKTPKLITKLNRMELLFSGERVLKRSDLIEILKTNPTGFQLETAINTYMIKNKKNIYWVQSSNINFPKIDKFGKIKGELNNLRMFWEVFKYGPLSFMFQLLFFARKQIII